MVKETTMDTEELKLSNQAMGAVMMALQESLMNQLDIVPILRNFKLENGPEGLIVKNPPTVRITNDESITDDDLKNMVK
jgi:hypothetical protein